MNTQGSGRPEQSSSNPNKRQKFDQNNISQSAEETLNQQVHQENVARKRPNNDQEVARGKKLKLSRRDYFKSGLVRNLHGDVYQLKLLMLFLKRGLDKQYSFTLATEWTAAEKFDDIVFEYMEEDKKICRFLQAKHKQCESKKISAKDLLTEKDEEFNLQKYFISYCKIKRNPNFNGELKDFVICTNIDLNDDLQNCFERVEDEDNILDTKGPNNSKESKRLKFNIDKFSKKEDLISILKDSSDLIRLAKKLAECVVNEKKIELKDPLFKLYHGALANEVIDIKSKKLYDERFLNNQKLPDEVKKFREVFVKVVKEKEPRLLQSIKDKTLNLSNNFGLTNRDTYFPKDYITDQEICEFFEKLVFAVNQPNEVELGKIIEAEIGKNTAVNLIDTEFIASKFQKFMLDWLKEKEGHFLPHEDGKAFFKEAEQKISKLILIGPTLEYNAKIEKFGIAFREEPSGLSDFLASEKIQVFNLVNPHKTILSSIKVCQALRVKPEYQKDDSYIFVCQESLLRLENHVIKAFESRASSNLLVIECKAVEENVGNLYSQLSKIIHSNSNKKIILITQENNPLADEFEKDFSDEYIKKKDERNSLTDLEDEESLIKEGTVEFQGEEVLEGLETLIDESSKHLIDGEVLSKLIDKDTIKVGSKVPQKSDHGSPAYNVIMPEEIKITRFGDEDIKDDVFVISGIEKEELKKRKITDKKIFLFEECDLNDKNTKQFILIDKKDCDYIKKFEKVCHKYQDKIIHFIEFKDDKFMWNRYYDPKFYTDREFYQIEIDATKLCKYATEVDKKDDILAVSGITKEDFEKEYKIDKRVIKTFSGDDNLDGSQPIIILGEEKYFSYLSNNKKLKNFNIHWLESKETKLFWKRSKGETSKLSKLVVSEPGDLTHNSLLEIVNDTRCTVIASLSGMGKSTTLTHLSESYKKKEGLNWVMRVNLRDYRSEIDKLPDKYDEELEEVVNFFSKIDKEGLKDAFAKNLFKHRLREENCILLLFDGFDEINSDQEEGDTEQSADKQKKITDLLKFLKIKTKARIVVTTRPYEKQKISLENELSVLSYTFKPIENERLEFLSNFWKRSVKLKYSENEVEESQYEKFAESLIKMFHKAIREEKPRFMGIPLHLRMLAEVHLEKFDKFCRDCQNDDFQDLNTFDLYKEFVKRKYKIYFSEKTGLSSTEVINTDLDMLKEQYEKMHKRLAFKYLFSGSTEPFKLFFSTESFFIEHKMPNEEKTRELKRIGITQSRSKDEIDFIHRTFAEYFVSKLIYERLKQKLENPNYSEESKVEMCKFLLNHIFVKKENNIIRSFINFELADKSVNLEYFWSRQIDHLKNKEPLLVTLKEGLGNIFSFVLQSEKDKRIKELISVPREHIKKLCDDGEYREADSLSGNALKFLIKEKGEDHLEVAFMQRYRANAFGTSAENTKDNSEKKKWFDKKKDFLEEALSTFDKHLKAAKGNDAEHQEDYFQQALSTFKEDFDSNVDAKEAQTANDKNEEKIWIRVLEMEIARAIRNLANAYGDLGDLEESIDLKLAKKKKKKSLLEENVLPTFENYLKIHEDPKTEAEEKLLKILKVEIAKATRNLANAYGDLGDLESGNKKLDYYNEKKSLLKEALSTFVEYGVKLSIAEAKRNLGNAYGKLGKSSKRKVYLEEALPYLKEHYGLLDFKVTKAQNNLSKTYTKLGYPLHGAVIAGNSNEVAALFHDNDVNRQTKDDFFTPLHLAVREGHPDIVKLLLDRKAILNNRNKNKETPLDLAKKQFYLNRQIYQNRQIYKNIIDILETHKKKTDPIHEGGEVSAEECLSD